jgi:hypothetical protein
MCKYCAYSYHDGWTQLLAYDEVYQSAIAGDGSATYGFHDPWDELKRELY